jgi:hypothetical protein
MKRDLNLRAFGLILLLTIVALVYLTPVVQSGNFLWFLPVFDTRAEKIIVYRHGEQITLQPADPDFDELTDVSNQLISNIKAVHRTFGISESGLEALRAEGVAVELFYAEPLKLPHSANLSGPNQLLIPLSGHYVENPIVIRGFDGEYWGAALRVGDLDRLQAAVEALGN